MKININGFEVEIKARATKYNERMNKTDTLAFLNRVAMWAMWSADIFDEEGSKITAEEARNAAHEINRRLLKEGW